MQHILGITFRGNDAEVMESEDPQRFFGLYEVVKRAETLMKENPDIIIIKVYEVFDGVRKISADGRYQQVHELRRQI